MREIKFRAWDKTARKMMMPAWLCNEDGCSPSDDGGWNNPEPYYLDSKNHHILMQFTGLKDKSGKEIYEGDIVTCPDLDEVYFCEWDEDFAGFDFNVKGKYTQEYLGGAQYKNIEIIGNIYENP